MVQKKDKLLSPIYAFYTFSAHCGPDALCFHRVPTTEAASGEAWGYYAVVVVVQNGTNAVARTCKGAGLSVPVKHHEAVSRFFFRGSR